MADANLNVKVGSTGIEQTNAGLEKLVRTSGAVEAAAKRVGISTAEMQARIDAASASSKKLADSQNAALPYGIQFTKAQQSVANSLEDQIAKFSLNGRAYAQYIALRKAGVSADTEAGQKISQLSGLAYDMEQKFDKANSTTRNFADTLTKRFVVGFLITQLRQVVQQIASMNAELARTGDIAQRFGASSASVQGGIGAAGSFGISPSAFLDAYAQLNASIAQAKRGTGDLYSLFKLNGVQIKDQQSNFLAIADLVANAKDNYGKIQVLQAAGLPSSEAWVRLMEQGSSALKDLIAGFPKLSDAELEAAKILDRQFNEAFANIERYGKQAFVGISETIKGILASDLQDILAVINAAKWVIEKTGSLPGIPTPFGIVPKGVFSAPSNISLPNASKLNSANGPSNSELGSFFQGAFRPGAFGNYKVTKTPQDSILELQRVNQQISAMGNLATADQLATQKRNELNIANQQGLKLAPSIVEAIVNETRLQKEAADGSARLQFGLGTEADIRKQILAAIPPQVRAEAELTQAYQIQTEQLRMRNEIAQAALPGLKQLELSSKDVRTQLDTLGQGLVNGITNPLVDLASGATKAGDAFKQMGLNIIRSIEQMIVNMTIAAPIARGLLSVFAPFLPAGATGGVSGGVGIGLGTTSTLYANGGVQSGAGISAFSNSIVDRPTIFPFAKGIGLMGEAGAEAIMPLTRIGGKLGVRAEGGNSSNISVNIGTIALPQDPNGNDPSGSIRAAAVSKALEGTVRSIVKDEMVRGQRPGGMLNRSAAV